MLSTELVLTEGFSSTVTIPTRKAVGKRKDQKWAKGFASLCDDLPQGPSTAKTLGAPIQFIPKSTTFLEALDIEKDESPTVYTPRSSTSSDRASGKESNSVVSTPGSSTTSDVINPVEVQDSAEEHLSSLSSLSSNSLVCPEWIGTSQFQVNFVLELQKSGALPEHIEIRKLLSSSLDTYPYDPLTYIQLAQIDNKLGFCDIAAANAHKALLLISYGLPSSDSQITCALPKLNATFLDWTDEVRATVAKRNVTSSSLVIDDDLDHLRLQAYQALMEGLVGCAAFSEALFVVAKEALRLYPQDYQLDHFRMIAKGRYKERYMTLKALNWPIKTLSLVLKKGKIMQKKYPWLNNGLHHRTPKMVQQVNEGLTSWNSIEIRPVVFEGSYINESQKDSKDENFDVGPLGIFAKRDIKQDDIILIDPTLLSISNVPASELQYCDACNSCLNPPYVRREDIVWASCCDRVAFCSVECRDTATKGYHSILCGNDLDWLYKDIEDITQAWGAISFSRLAAIVLADQKTQTSTTVTHPLQHHLLTRMAANYAPPSKIEPGQLYDFSYQENIVSPCKILLTLGVDIFKTRGWDLEVIMTALWRLDNNANMGRTNIYPKGESHPHPSRLPTPPSDIPQKRVGNPVLADNTRKFHAEISTININPNYLFFNHSCTPNVYWSSALPSPEMDVEGMKWDGGLLRPGNSAVRCVAIRDIKAGEELKISYVGDPLGMGEGRAKAEKRKETRIALEKWFPGGCGCEICKMEDEDARGKGGVSWYANVRKHDDGWIGWK